MALDAASWAVIAAMELEASLVRGRLRQHQKQVVTEVGRLWRGRIGAHRVALMRCGMGEARAVAALQWLVLHERLQGVLSIGFAGGLRPELATGDVLLVDRIQAWSKRTAPENGEVRRERVIPNVRLTSLADQAAQRAGLSRHRGLLLSHKTLVPSALDKCILGRRTGALAVDMESYWIGSLAAAHGLPFICLRAVLDPCDTEVNLPLEGLTTPDGGLRPSGAVMTVMRQPGLVKSFWMLWRLSSLTQRRLKVWLDHFWALLSTISSEKDTQRP